MGIAALIPTLHRPDGLRRVLESLSNTAPDVTPVVSCDPDDRDAHRIAVEYGARLVICREKRRGPAAAWNEALRAEPDYDIYVLASDDCEFLPGWLESALTKLDGIGGSGLVGLRYKKQGVRTLSAFYLMTRDFIVKHHGGVAAVPHYTSWYIDAEACGRAQRAGCYEKTDEIVILHHWLGPDGDETYRIAADRRAANKELYKQRREVSFPDDFEPILKEAGSHG